jgi:transcriptional regulator with XRE-family HTH domain
MISSDQMRGGRALLGLSQADVAAQAGVSIPTLKRAEAGTGIKVSEKAVAAIQAALETAGVLFIDENGDGPGVRLKKERPTR